MSGRISNLFSSVAKVSSSNASQADKNHQEIRASASLYVEPSSVHQLFDLIKRNGNFRLSSSHNGFEAHLGQRRFTITDSSEFIQLTLHHADALTPEAAETSAELAFILLPQTDNPLKLQASTIDDERRLWQGVKKFFPKHAISAFNEDQNFRLEFLEKKYQAPETSGSISASIKNNSLTSSGQNPNPGFKLNNLMGGFLKADEFGYKQSSIYVESDSIGFLMELAKENDEISMTSTQEHFQILLRGHVISIENYQDLSAIRLLSPMNFGAAELMLRILRFMYGDSTNNNLSNNLENNLESSSESNSEANGYPNIKLSFDTQTPEQEKIILEILRKYAMNSWELSHRNPEQKIRIEEYLRGIKQNEKLSSENSKVSPHSSALFMKYRSEPFSKENKASSNTNSPDLKGGA